MALKKLSFFVDSELLEEARQRAGQESMSKFVNEALKFYLQSLRIREVESELTAQYGPIPEEVKNRVAELDWLT